MLMHVFHAHDRTAIVLNRIPGSDVVEVVEGEQGIRENGDHAATGQHEGSAMVLEMYSPSKNGRAKPSAMLLLMEKIMIAIPSGMQ